MKRLEEENNRLFIDAYGLQDELTPDVPIEQITLTVNPAYRYGKKLSDDEWSVEEGFPEELETRFREDTMQELVSYAIGCTMGRYSLDEPGLIYAHSGNVGFDPSRYQHLPGRRRRHHPDHRHRLVRRRRHPPRASSSSRWPGTRRTWKRISRSWPTTSRPRRASPAATPSAATWRTSSSRTTCRPTRSARSTGCFSSGKQKAFQCLVYLHRYHEGTLARMRMEYVVPLQSKMAARIDALADDIEAASSSAQAKRLQKERDKLTKQLDELRRYDEQLRHYADQRIALDLDDGVKVNYGKFGDLLAEVKAVTGKSAD